QRVKENAADYRYFPDPDLPPFHPRKIAGGEPMPELPQAKRIRFHAEYGLSYADVKLLSDDEAWADFTDNVMSELSEWVASLKDETSQEKPTSRLSQLAGSWMTNKLTALLAERKMDIRLLKISPENFAEFVALIFTNKINSTNAQKLLTEMIDSGVDMDPTHLMEEKGYGQVNDAEKIGEAVADIIRKFPDQVDQFKSGKEPVIKFLIGMVMRATEGTADPVVVEKLLREQLR
ncbi:MAG: hypothetical protein AAB408_02545, partial [Patescibacteria group bacterium]